MSARRALLVATAAAVLAAGVASSALAVGMPATSSTLAWGPPRTIDRHHRLVLIRCPSASLCLASDGAGNTFWSRHPRLAGSWHRVRVGLAALACPSTRLCVGAALASSSVRTTTSPTGSARAWRSAFVDRYASPLSAIGCRFTLCVTGDNTDNLFASTNPAGGRHTWRHILLPSNGDSAGIMSGIACPSWSLCIAVDQSTGEGFLDDIYVSTQPTQPNSWQLIEDFTSNSFNGIACPSTALCVAPTQMGEVMSSTTPAIGSSWQAATLLPSLASINAVSCPSTSFCVLGDADGAIETSTDPSGGPTAWSAPQTIAPGDSIESLACPSAGLCFAVTRNGALIVGSG
jgi:hypothetical protein